MGSGNSPQKIDNKMNLTASITIVVVFYYHVSVHFLRFSFSSLTSFFVGKRKEIEAGEEERQMNIYTYTE